MKSEAEIQQEIRLASFRHGTPLLRNNSGATFDESGRMVRYGLGNDSKKLNDTFKSSDLVGIYPVIVTPEMVGRTLGVFFAVECKPEGWQQTPGDKRAAAQAAFGDWVKNHGGIFTFATRKEDVWGPS